MNSNIRCIEIEEAEQLKGNNDALNSNIRCIEIDFDDKYNTHFTPLNSNIRCIEMLQLQSAMCGVVVE